MRILSKILWIALSLLLALSLAMVTRLCHPAEKVNALWLVTAALCFYAIMYRFYASFLAARVLALDPARSTPAVSQRDGTDYEPTSRFVLFGHHFAAIAGAGPLIGPMLAAQFGYLPGFLWILIGSALAGGVHDMVILTASVRRNGRSLSQIARDEIGPVGGLSISAAVIFIILVALAGLGLAVVNALYENPWGVFTIAATIPIALGMGAMLKGDRSGRVAWATAIGVALLLLALIAGHHVPGSCLDGYFRLSRNELVIALAVYGFTASVLPVWLLLCPRDYLSTYMKIGTVFLLVVGVLVLAPSLQMPAVTRFAQGGGPIIPGKLFPFMFITIACGAISGFHALIASGTTPKLIKSEKDIPFIGYGAMLMEGFVGLMALIAATVLIPGDYFAINSTLSLEALAGMGFPAEHLHDLSALVGIDVQGRPGGAVSLAVGMASILSAIPGLKGILSYWYQFALLFEALFILTTVDAGTRVARFLLQEAGGKAFPRLGNHQWMPGVMLCSLLVVAAWAYLIFSGNVSSIWPMFGVANQLLAAMAFGVGALLILKSGKGRFVWVCAIPGAFMFITTLTAAFQLFFIFRAKALAAVSRLEAFQFRLDAALVGLMAFLALTALADILVKVFARLRAEKGAAQ